MTINTGDLQTENLVAPSPTSAPQFNLPPSTPPAPTEQFFSKDDIEKARKQEKDKLYPQMEKMQQELAELKAAREAQEALEAQQRAEAEAEARRKREEDMDTRSLLEQKEQEWAARLDEERLERERAFALLEREREYQELYQYKANRVAEESNSIAPELIDLVQGSSKQEIEQSIADLKVRSEAIVNNFRQLNQNARQDMQGSRVTNPPSGPLDTDPDHQSFSPEAIKAMSAKEYEKYRGTDRKSVV